MRVIANELKKIWNIKILAIIAILCILFFFAFMHIEIIMYRTIGVGFAHYLTERYGTTLELDEFEDFLNYREVIVEELDMFIASRPIFVEAGILSYNDYENFREEWGSRYETLSDVERSLWYDIVLEWGTMVRTITGEILTSENEEPEAYSKIMAFENVIGLYQVNIIGVEGQKSNIDFFIEHHHLSESELNKLNEIKESRELLSIMPHIATNNTRRYTQSLAILVILATVILVSPLVTTDIARKVNCLQYSSKQGRGILVKQLIAVLISAFTITTILVLVFAGIYNNGTQVQAFWGNGINSFMSGSFHWLTVTLGQYYLLIIFIIYLLSIVVAIFAFIISRFSKNMIRLTFKVIPLFIATMILSNWILNNFLIVFSGDNWLLQLSTLLFSLIIGTGIAIFVIYKENSTELL